MKHGLKPNLVLNQMADCPRAHPEARHRAVRNVDDVRPGISQQLRSREQLFDREAARWVDLDREHKLTGFQLGAQFGGTVLSGGSLFESLSVFDKNRADLLRLGLPEGRAHVSDVLCGSATASPDDVGANLSVGPCIFGEVVRGSRVHDAPTHLLRPTRVRHHGELGIRDGAPHGLQHAEQLCRSLGAVCSNHIGSCVGQQFGRLCGSVAKQGAIVARESDRRDHREIAHHLCGLDSLTQLIQVALRLERDQIRASLRKRRDLFLEGFIGFFGFDASKGSQSNSERADAARDKRLNAGFLDSLLGQFHPRSVDFSYLMFQPMRSELVQIRAEGVGLYNLSAGLQVLSMNFQDQLGPR